MGKNKKKERNVFHSVNLLPEDYQKTEAENRLKRLLAKVSVVALIIGVGLVGGAYLKEYVAYDENRDLIGEIEALKLKKEEFSEVIELQTEIADLINLREVAAEDEINWSGFLKSLNRTLQDDMKIESLQAEIMTPEIFEEDIEEPTTEEEIVSTDEIEEIVPATDFLQVLLILSVEDLSSLNEFKEALNTFPGLVSADFSIATKTSDSGIYSVEMELIFDEDAKWGRFKEEEVEEVSVEEDLTSFVEGENE